MTTRWFTASAAVLLLLLFAPGASAQAVKGGLLGNVVDPAGLALPGVTVTITETNTNISYNSTTNESGYYSFPSLKDGTYRVAAELSGLDSDAHEVSPRTRAWCSGSVVAWRACGALDGSLQERPHPPGSRGRDSRRGRDRG